VGSVIALGQFRALDLADLWRTKEIELMCPNNPIGTVDVYFATGHGSVAAGSLPLVHALQPRVAIMQNGTRKGGAPGPMQTMLSSPGLEALWQMHWSYNALLEQNSPGLFVANLEDAATIAGVLTAPPRGSGPGAGARNSAPAAPVAPATPPPADAVAPQTGGGTPAGQPPATAAPAGRGRSNATGHTPAYWLKIVAQPDGSFTITNPRNGFSKSYSSRTGKAPRT
jgi:hypothetical protein